MKTLIIALLVGSSFLTVHGQIASVDKTDILSKDIALESKSITTDNSNNKSVISIKQLSVKISESLAKNEMMRKGGSISSLVLEISMDEIGHIKSYQVSDSNSPIMSKIVLELMELSDSIRLDKKGFEGISKVKIPVRYTL